MTQAKAFVRKWPSRHEGKQLTMVVMLCEGLDTLDEETLYAFDVTEIPGTVVLREVGERDAREEMRGKTADGILSRF